MDEMESLSHTNWECKYHAVFIPKCRRKTLYGELRQHLGEVFRKLTTQKESRIEEGHLLPDHVPMMIAIPPKYAVSQVIGFIKGKSAIHLARVYGERKRNIVGQHFWACGCYVSTVGREETVIGDYIRNQEQEDKRLDQNESVALTGHRSDGPRTSGPRWRPRTAALSGSQTKALGSAGGHLRSRLRDDSYGGATGVSAVQF
jgi:putative transposase